MLQDKVLSLLKSGEELSGEAMSQTLGVSRAAVWKAIEALRGEGTPSPPPPGGATGWRARRICSPPGSWRRRWPAAGWGRS